MPLTVRIIFDAGIISGIFNTYDFYNAELKAKSGALIEGTIICGDPETKHKEMLVFRANPGDTNRLSRGEKFEITCDTDNSRTKEFVFDAKVVAVNADICIALID